jgi:hypothetical protein
MNVALAALMTAAASLGGLPSIPRARKRPTREIGPGKVACRQCGAQVGEVCDRLTLGRYHHHRVRVDDAKARREEG